MAAATDNTTRSDVTTDATDNSATIQQIYTRVAGYITQVIRWDIHAIHVAVCAAAAHPPSSDPLFQTNSEIPAALRQVPDNH